METVGRRIKPSPSMVVALMSLFVALSGVTYAATALEKNSVKSKHIKDKAIKGQDVKDNALTGTQIDESSLTGIPLSGAAGGDLTGSYPNPTIANNAVNSAKIADNAVGSSEVAADSLAAGDLAPDSVNSSELVADSVGSSEINTDVVDGNELIGPHVHTSAAGSVAAGTDNNGFFNTDSATATCAGGEELISWSVDLTSFTGGEETVIQEATPNFTTEAVTVTMGNDDDTAETFTVQAWCI